MVGSIPLASRVLGSTALLTLLLFEPSLTGAQADLASRVDAIMAPFTSDGPGATNCRQGWTRTGPKGVRAGQSGDPDTDAAEMVFELGSVTKQFTSTAILMLAQQGKLALDDDIRKDVPTSRQGCAHHGRASLTHTWH